MEKRRVSGRKVAIGLLAIIAAILVTAITLWWRTREPHGPILSFAAVDEHTIVLARRGVAQRDFVHIQVRDLREHGQTWSMALFSTQPGATPIVSDGLAALRVRDAQGRPETHAFDLVRGRFAFRAAAVTSVPNASLVADEAELGGHLLVAYGAPISRAFLLDMSAGRAVFERAIEPGSHPVRVAVADGAAYIEQGDGSVRQISLDGRADQTIPGASVCGLGARRFLLDALSSRLDLGGVDRPAELSDLTPPSRLVACASNGENAILVATNGSGLPRTDVFSVSGPEVRRIATLPLRVAAGFGAAHGRTDVGHVVVPFENGYLGVYDIARGTELARYRVRNAREALRVDAFSNGAVVPLGERVIVFSRGRPHVLQIVPQEGTSVFADADGAGDTIFLAVEREVVALDARTLALRDHTGDVEVLTEDVETLLTRAPSP